MHIDTSKTTSKSGKTYTRYLIRQCYRENGKIKQKTIANISNCTEAEIRALKLAFKHKDKLTKLGSIDEIKIKQGKAVGAVSLLLQLANRLGLSKALGSSREGKLALWQVFARIIEHGSRLSSVRLAGLHACELLGMERFNEDDLYNNLDWLAEQQSLIEDRMFKINGRKVELFLYDVTSSYFEGEENELAEFGYNRDGKKGKRQIVIGLLCDDTGDPISVEVFNGNTKDNKTLDERINKAASRFGTDRVTFVGDRGMIKSMQISNIKGKDFHYITAITKPQIEKLLSQGVIQLGLFDENLAEITHENVRYILRRNPVRKEEIACSRAEKLKKIINDVNKRNQYVCDHKKAKITTSLRQAKRQAQKLKIDAWLDFRVNETTRSIEIITNEAVLAEISLLDGCYVLKTDLPKDAVSKETIHERYKDLAMVEQAFRTSKTALLELRPIHVRLASRTRGHVFVVMLAYRIIHELKKYWSKIDVTVEEGIAALSGVCSQEIQIDEFVVNQIPTPSKLIGTLLDSAKVKLPTILPSTKLNVTTRKKLVSRRKAL